MEGYGQQLKCRGTTLDTDASSATRLSQRPLSSQPGGVQFEDFGSDFRRASSRPRSRAPSVSRKLPKPPAPRDGPGVIIDFGDDGGAGTESSDDEIDFLSGSSRHNSAEPEKAKTMARPRSASRPTYAIDRHQANPDYKSIDLKSFKIPKKSAAASASTSHTPVASGARSKAHDASSSSSRAPRRTPSQSLSSTESSKDDWAKKVPLRERSPNRSRRPLTPPLEVMDKDEQRTGQCKDADRTPRPSRPAPRPVNKCARSSLGKSQTVPDLATRPSQESEPSQPLSRSHTLQGFPVSPLVTSDSSSEDLRSLMPKKRIKKRARGEMENRDKDNPISALSPLSSQTRCRSNSPEVECLLSFTANGKGKARADPIGDLSPLASPVRSPRKSAPASFPTISPLSSPRHDAAPSETKAGRQPGSRPRSILASSDDNTPRKGIRPFPMSTQVLASIGRRSPHNKRNTPDNESKDDGGIDKKRLRQGQVPFKLNVDSDSDEDGKYMRISRW